MRDWEKQRIEIRGRNIGRNVKEILKKKKTKKKK